MQELQGCAPIKGQEQLPKRNQGLLTGKSSGLENVHHIRRAASSSALDHRCHQTTEQLWGMHEERNELRQQEAKVVENFRWLPMVAP